MLGHPKPGPAMSAGRGRTRRTALGLALTAVVVATVSGCGLLGGSDSSSASSGNLEKSKIKVSILPATDLGPFWLAQDNGYFKAEGLEVESVTAASGQASMTKAINGEADIAFSTYQPFFIAKSTGTADVQLVADATAVNPKTNAIVTVPNSPVKNVNDLAGKKIAVTALNTASHILTVSVMKDHGVDTSKVQWVPIPLPNIAQALRQGQVDAAYLPEPWITQAAKLAGATPIIDIDTGASKDFPLTGYGTTAKWVQANPKTLAAFQRAMQKATRDSSDRSKIEPLMVKYAHVDADTAKLMPLPAYLSTLDARRLQRVPDLLLQMGIITAKIDAAPMIAPQANS